MSKPRLKIVHIILSKGFAGTERSTAESCNSQCNEHDVVLVCSKKHARSSGASILNHIDSRVRVVQVGPGLLLGSRLQKILDAELPDIIHAHLRKPTRVLAKCRTNAVCISTLHIGVNGPQFLDMHGLIAISPWQLNEIPNVFKGEVRWIRNSLTPHPKPSLELTKELKREMDIADNEYVVGGVGRLSDSKGWDTLIEAFKRAKIPQSVLVLIGEGRDKEKLIRHAKSAKINVRFEPYKHRVKDFYSTFDVFVCPSREEPMGRVVLEALDAGLPVIASNIEGPKDILTEYPGTLFPVDNVEALADVLKKSYSDKMAGKTPKRPDLSAHYTDKVNSDILAFYQELFEKKSKPQPLGT